jgi:uroporphyrin-III C-methyltransferase
MMSKVFLVGAGPGDPELLTRKAFRVLSSADIVLHDSLVSEEILRLIPVNAERIDVGKRRGYKLLNQEDINALLVAASRNHNTVVRLKGGDPLLFGRAAEEIQALREAAIEFEIIPGITAAFGAAATARIPLTDRALASSVLFTTYSRSPEAERLLRNSLTLDTTVVIYMPGVAYADVSNWLLQAGLPPETPCLVVSNATRADQITKLSTATGLRTLSPLPAPAVLIVGRAVAPDTFLPVAADWLDASIGKLPPARDLRWISSKVVKFGSSPRIVAGEGNTIPTDHRSFANEKRRTR